MPLNKKIAHILLALFAVSLMASISAELIFGGFLILLGCWRFFKKQMSVPLEWNARRGALLAYILWSSFASLWNGSLGLVGVLSMQSTFVLYILFASIFDEREIRFFLLWLLAAAVFVGALGLVQASLYSHRNDSGDFGWIKNLPGHLSHYLSTRGGRASGTRSHPLTYAESFIVPFFLILPYLQTRMNPGSKKMGSMLLGFGMFASMALAVTFSLSRGVWLGLVAGTIVYLLRVNGRRMRVLLGIVLVCVVCSSLASSLLRNRFLSSFSSRYGDSGDQDSKATRYKLWKASFASIKKSPVVGVGLKGAYLIVLEEATGKTKWSESHNMYIQAALDLGLPGFILFLVLFAVFGWSTLQTPAPWGPAFSGLVAAFLVAGLTESWMGDKEVAILFWVSMGLHDYFQVRQHKN